MSQRSLKRQLQEAKADAAFLRRLAENVYAIHTDARNFPKLREAFEPYSEDLGRRIAEQDGFVKSLAAQIRVKAKP